MMRVKVFRTEVMEAKFHPALKLLCSQTKNLYNRAMFIYKQHYSQTKKSLSYQQLDRILKKEEVYRVLPLSFRRGAFFRLSPIFLVYSLTLLVTELLCLFLLT